MMKANMEFMKAMLTNFQGPVTGSSALNTPNTGERAYYLSWKDSVKAYLDSTKCGERFRGHYIFESLRGEAKSYIGEGESWLGREDQLWKRLDSKYGCRWTMIADLVKQTLCTESPTVCGPELNDYLEKMCNQIRKITRAGIAADQMAVQKVLLEIPKEKANELRAALRVLKGMQNSYSS